MTSYSPSPTYSTRPESVVGPRMSTAIWSAESSSSSGLINLLPVASLVVTRKVCFTPLTAAVRAAPVAVVKGKSARPGTIVVANGEPAMWDAW